MAARKHLALSDRHREKIRASMLINRLCDHVEGKLEVPMDSTQVTAALGLLNKVLPNLQATTIEGNVDHRYVARMPDTASTADEWQKQHAPTTIQ